MSQFNKLIESILAQNPNLRFQDLKKVLTTLGYTITQPRRGGSHYVFRKSGCNPITIPKDTPLKKVYIELVADVVRADLEEG